MKFIWTISKATGLHLAWDADKPRRKGMHLGCVGPSVMGARTFWEHSLWGGTHESIAKAKASFEEKWPIHDALRRLGG